MRSSRSLTGAAFAAAADAALRRHRVELVALAGFMRLLDTGFVEAWRDRIMNIHPSLLPVFPGLHPQRQALAAGARFSGCTVRFVRPETDSGPIIAQAVVPVHDDDDEERLAARILAQEHRLYPLAFAALCRGAAPHRRQPRRRGGQETAGDRRAQSHPVRPLARLPLTAVPLYLAQSVPHERGGR